ncbi:TraB/GumN family protein [Vibrio campbellii]|uniref:TraB/GumN family protein n=1 Tax=Vibrio campbellii TaxID=680 RepID=A0ABY5ID69_9VIBR|nr:TraB/GumN family protein [Vibrio campbellii]UTZ21031.1 TraB/GumN family protein [Vibrio campbellii]UTZ31622.1 TraB/GumN family protein [Vibrio campbellii]
MFRLLSVMSSLIVFFTSYSVQAEPQHWLAKKGDMEYMIIGSVHVGDKTMYPLPKAVTQFLKNSDGLIIEADVRNTEGVTYPKTAFLAKDVLDRTQRKHLAEIANDLGLQEVQLLNAPPWSAALTIQLMLVNKLGYASDQGVDMHLINLADKQQVPVLSLESVQFQLDLIAGQKDGGKEFLLSSIEEYDGGDKLVQCLIDSWKSGDGRTLEEASMSEQSSDEFNQAFLYDRNRDWAEKLDSGRMLPKKSGQYTIVVGSLHLVGKDNLVELLEERGFTVEPLGNTHKAHCDI